MPQRTDVFISSTSLDLPDHRRAVTDAILSLGLFPSGMETWAVRDENAIALCRRKIDEAEIYVGIYAYRYGWTPAGYGGKSITELEYDWAGERGIPRLRFIMADSHPWPEAEKEKGAAQEALDAFKSRLKPEVVGFFTTPDDLKAQVIAALAGYAPAGKDALLIPYLRALHVVSSQSGLLRALDPRTNDPSYGGRGVTIDQVYTPLKTRQRVRRDDDGRIVGGIKGDEGAPDLSVNYILDRTADQGQTDDGKKSLDLGDVKFLGNDIKRRQLTENLLTVLEAADGIDRLALLGDPGGGKSTFVNYLTLCLSGALLDPDAGWLARLERAGWTHGVLVPLVVVLRDFAQSADVNAAPTANTLRRYIDALVEKEAPGAAAALGRHTLVLLDGLDEVPGERRGYVRDAIDLYVRGCAPGARVIVTCRVLSYADPQYRVPGFVEQTIAPLEDEQIAAFIDAWYSALVAVGAIDHEVADRRAGELVEAINSYELSKLISNPMLLTVMALVHNHLGTLPREMARLYHECVLLLLLRWKPNNARSLLELMKIGDNDLLGLVWNIAYDAHDQQSEQEDAADIAQTTVELIARGYVQGDAGLAQAFCEYVEKQAGLLIGRGFGRHGTRIYTFPHRTFQEFLAGCHLAVNHFSEAATVHALRGESWYKTLLLATGHLVFNQNNNAIAIDAVSRILAEAASHDDDSQWRLYPLAGEMLLLVGLNKLARNAFSRKTLADAQYGLAALLEAGTLSVRERAAAGRTLASLGDPRPGVGVRPDGLPDIVWCDVSDDKGSQNDANPPLPRYAIAKYPVTNAQFQAFAESDDYDDPRWWDELAAADADRRVEDVAVLYANHPHVDVSWYEAKAFANWLTVRCWAAGLISEDEVIRLPTEAEWERAANGMYAQERNHMIIGNTAETNIGKTCAVGMFPAGRSPVGALDMGGNVWEWCLDDYDNPLLVDMENEALHILRGGSWKNPSDLAYLKIIHHPLTSSKVIGFRLVRSFF